MGDNGSYFSGIFFVAKVADGMHGTTTWGLNKGEVGDFLIGELRCSGVVG